MATATKIADVISIIHMSNVVAQLVVVDSAPTTSIAGQIVIVIVFGFVACTATLVFASEHVVPTDH